MYEWSVDVDMEKNNRLNFWLKGCSQGRRRALAGRLPAPGDASSANLSDRQEPTARKEDQNVGGTTREFLGRWTPFLLGAIVLAFAAGGFGYYLHAFRENSISSLSGRSIAALDYYVSWESFSEVDEAKALLQASAVQIIQEMREQPGLGVYQVKIGSASRHNIQLTRVIGNLEQKIEEFKGTQQELLLVQELLWILWREGKHNQLVEVYLSVSYQHPTQVLVGHFADKALRSSQMIGREQDLIKAFQHITDIPLDFRAKWQVKSVMEGNNLVAQAMPPSSKPSL